MDTTVPEGPRLRAQLGESVGVQGVRGCKGVQGGAGCQAAARISWEKLVVGLSVLIQGGAHRPNFGPTPWPRSVKQRMGTWLPEGVAWVTERRAQGSTTTLPVCFHPATRGPRAPGSVGPTGLLGP